MQKKTFNQIIKIIERNFSISEFAYEDYSDNQMQELGLGRVEEVEQYGGTDQGSTWYSIKHFVDHDVYIKTDGYYSSYNGTDFHEGYGYEVLPTKVEVIQYQAAPVVVDTEDEVLTADELIQKLTNRIDKDDFGENGYKTVDEDLFGPNKIVDTVGNHEGAGSHAHTVRYFEKHDIYIKLNGFYSSYSGCDWGSYTEVKPKQKTIIEYN